jgi:hypothetical protein
MSTLTSQRQDVAPHELLTKESQRKMNRLSASAQRSSTARCAVYKAAHAGLPSLSETPDNAYEPDAEALDAEADGEDRSDSIESVPSLEGDSEGEDDRAPDSDPASDPEHTDFTAYDELDAEFPCHPPEEISMNHLETWARIFRYAHDSAPPSMAASSGADYTPHDSLDGSDPPGIPDLIYNF